MRICTLVYFCKHCKVVQNLFLFIHFSIDFQFLKQVLAVVQRETYAYTELNESVMISLAPRKNQSVKISFAPRNFLKRESSLTDYKVKGTKNENNFFEFRFYFRLYLLIKLQNLTFGHE